MRRPFAAPSPPDGLVKGVTEFCGMGGGLRPQGLDEGKTGYITFCRDKANAGVRRLATKRCSVTTQMGSAATCGLPPEGLWVPPLGWDEPTYEIESVLARAMLRCYGQGSEITCIACDGTDYHHKNS